MRRRHHEDRLAEANDAVLSARDGLKNIRDRDDEVSALSSSLIKLRRRNHFAEQIQIIMEGGK